MGTIRALFKFVFTALGLALIGMALLCVAFFSQIEAQIQKRIAARMTLIFGADTSIESLKWAPWQGQFAMVGVRIQNPPEFPPEPAFVAQQMTLNIDMPTIFSTAPHIELVHVEGAELHLRYGVDKGTNWGLLSNNALAFARARKAEHEAEREAAASSEDAPGRKVRVSAIQWDESLLRIAAVPIPVPVPPFRIEGEGTLERGLIASQMMGIVLRTVLREVGSLGGLVQPLQEALQRDLSEAPSSADDREETGTEEDAPITPEIRRRVLDWVQDRLL